MSPIYSSSKFTPEQIEDYRELAARLLKEKFDGNQTAFARALDINNTNIHRFVVKAKGGLSTKTAEALCQLAGLTYPLGEKPAKVVMKVHSNGSSTDPELEKAIDFFPDRWPPEVLQLARMLVEHRGIKMHRTEWIERLEEIEACVGDLVKNITK